MNRTPTGLYSIDNFTTRRGLGRDAYGPVITLAQPVTEAILNGERRDQSAAFNTDLLEHLKASVHPSDAAYCRLDFYTDSWLLVGMHVGSQCACFGVSGCRRSALDRGSAVVMRYDSHNIDTPEQAAAIVSTWLLWFNNTLSLTDFTQPHALA